MSILAFQNIVLKISYVCKTMIDFARAHWVVIYSNRRNKSLGKLKFF